MSFEQTQHSQSGLDTWLASCSKETNSSPRVPGTAPGSGTSLESSLFNGSLAGFDAFNTEFFCSGDGLVPPKEPPHDARLQEEMRLLQESHARIVK